MSAATTTRTPEGRVGVSCRPLLTLPKRKCGVYLSVPLRCFRPGTFSKVSFSEHARFLESKSCLTALVRHLGETKILSVLLRVPKGVVVYGRFKATRRNSYICCRRIMSNSTRQEHEFSDRKEKGYTRR